MTGQPDRDRRVLAVRCPAWRPPSLVSRQAARRLAWRSQPGSRPGEPGRSAGIRAGGQRGTGVLPRIEVLRPGICAFAVRGPGQVLRRGGGARPEDRRGGDQARPRLRGGHRRRDVRRAAGLQGRPQRRDPAGYPSRRSGSFRREGRRPSSRRARSPFSASPTWPICSSGSGSGRWASSPRYRPPRRGTGSEPTGCSRTGSPAGLILGRWPRARRRRTCPSRSSSILLPSSPSGSCSPPNRWPASCTLSLPRAGWPASGSRSRWSATTARRSPGCGGTTGCCPSSPWPSGCAGSSTAGGLAGRQPAAHGPGGRDQPAAAGTRSARPGPGPPAWPVGRCRGQRPGGTSGRQGPGDARPRRGAAARPVRRPQPVGPGGARPLWRYASVS